MSLMNAEEKVGSENIFRLIKNEKIPVNTIKNFLETYFQLSLLLTPCDDVRSNVVLYLRKLKKERCASTLVSYTKRLKYLPKINKYIC